REIIGSARRPQYLPWFRGPRDLSTALAREAKRSTEEGSGRRSALWPLALALGSSDASSMTCSRCGDVCSCVPDRRQAAGSIQAHLESDAECESPRLHAETCLIDAEAADASEQEFAASLERNGES